MKDLNLEQENIKVTGSAIQVRMTTEDPAKGYNQIQVELKLLEAVKAWVFVLIQHLLLQALSFHNIMILF